MVNPGFRGSEICPPRGAAASARPGFGLLAVLLVMLLVGAIASAAATLGVNAVLVNGYTLRESSLKAAADDALEIARARLNGDTTLYNDTAFVALETNAAVHDGAGNTIPGLTRTTWAGPGGIATGQYGRFGEIVSSVRDAQGSLVIRREAVMQESFAKFAYFTNSEGAGILFGGGDQIQGPLFSNDAIQIHSTGATFFGPVSTVQTISGKAYGTFKQTVTEHATPIRFPQIGNVTRLQGYAAAGGTAFTAGVNPPRFDQATMRIEFVWVDLNLDGRPTPDEGYIKVYTVNGAGSSAEYLSADVPTAPGNDLRNSQNCGHYHGSTFVTAYAHPNNGADNNVSAVHQPGVRCFLGGDSAISNGFLASTNGSSIANSNAVGAWQANPTPDPAVAGRPDGNYLFPISHQHNANFKGVIYVTGKVGVSGTVVGHVTLAASDNIIILDDLRYAVNRGAGGCQDLLGLYSGKSIVVADNVMSSPARYPGNNAWTTYGATADEFLDGVVMALDSFTVARLDGGAATQSTTTEPCNGSVWGRGCLFLTGGVIQGTRGRVAVTSAGGGGTGYLKRYSYDKCAAEIPPPYFPTTGWFERAQYYEVNPKGFDMGTYTSLLKARQ